ncbi:hypothetical protein NC653_010017 [Populus alba x Populus x berolinensis]|uniref:Uncharacterized protein n=1 Tax=Populus alba x Populus x berolinensis TaxID=444605 RepID=A0AAD6RAI3_9ROSI|nr:hypothetical protein NC653_010017 [Populus alba x Populus x berolinensis]
MSIWPELPRMMITSIIWKDQDYLKMEDIVLHVFNTLCFFSKMKPTLRSRFPWDRMKLNRQLVIQYARHRAVLGAKFHSPCRLE